MLILCITLGISLVPLLLKKFDDNDDGKKIAFFCLPEVFCDPKNMPKCVFGRGSVPKPTETAEDSPQTS